MLVKHADVLVTMDGARRELRDGGLYIEDNRIVAVGPTAELPQTADEVLDMRGHLVIPGLVNTHHHMYQSLTRAIPAAQNAELFGWLTNLYKVWANLTPEMIEVSTLTAMAELLLSGCTTSSDHLVYLPERQPARRQHRRGAPDRHAFSRCARQHERGAEGRRLAAGFGGRA